MINSIFFFIIFENGKAWCWRWFLFARTRPCQMIYESKYKNIIKYTFPPNVENPLQFPSTLTFLEIKVFIWQFFRGTKWIFHSVFLRMFIPVTNKLRDKLSVRKMLWKMKCISHFYYYYLIFSTPPPTAALCQHNWTTTTRLTQNNCNGQQHTHHFKITPHLSRHLRTITSR